MPIEQVRGHRRKGKPVRPYVRLKPFRIGIEATQTDRVSMYDNIDAKSREDAISKAKRILRRRLKGEPEFIVLYVDDIEAERESGY